MHIKIYELIVVVNVACLLICSLKIRQNREENNSRIKLLRKLQRERLALKREQVALKRERVLTDAAVKRARSCKVD